MKKCMAVVLIALLTMAMVLSASAVIIPDPIEDEETGISYIQLLSCDTKPSGRSAYAVDAENAQEGDACLSFNVGSGQVNEMILEEAIDGTGYDTLEFELYVSDLVLFDKFGAGGMNSGFEVTSSGMCDYQEISWKLAEIRDHHTGEELVAGWNHIILPLSTATTRDKGSNHDELTGPFDIANINFMRFFMVNDDGTGIVVKIDNICLSDRQAVEEEARKLAELQKAADRFVKKIEETDEITAENYEDLKLKVISCRSMYDKLSDEAKALVPAAALEKLERCEKAIADFEANPPSDEPTDDPTDEPTDEPTDDEQPEENPPVEEPKKGGCGASMALSAVALLGLAMTMGTAVLRKKED